MSAPVLWVLFPATVGCLLLFLRKKPRALHGLGVLTVFLLAVAAWWAPIGEPIDLRLWAGLPTLTIADTLLVLGRRITLDNTSRSWLVLVFTSASFWFAGAYAARVQVLFIPLGLIIAAIITAALAVQPVVYAILLFAILALVCVPLLAAPGKPVSAGVLRFMTFQVMGVALLLLADWLLPIALVNPGDAIQTLRAVLLMFLGFALVSAILPFHTWAPMLAQHAHPYTVAFVFVMISLAASFLGLDYLERFGALQTRLGPMNEIILLAGIAMILASGLWAAFERDLGRILGFALITGMGVNLISIALWSSAAPGVERQNLFNAQILSTQLALAIWTLALTILRPVNKSLQFRAIQGLARQLPVAAAGVILASFSIAGVPLLASFPSLSGLLAAAGQDSPGLVGAAMLGLTLSMVAAIRSLAALTAVARPAPDSLPEPGVQIPTVAQPTSGMLGLDATSDTLPLRLADTRPLRGDTIPLNLKDTAPQNLELEGVNETKSSTRPRESRMQLLLILTGCGLLFILGLLLPWLML
jgi:formate hydrogenlyase subunit 3/multisubunit Na+/H+ antiporter MnhD subunit